MKTIKRQVEPRWSVAIAQAVKSIRVRILRQGVAALGVMLGIAFYASVRTSQALSPPNPLDPASIEAGNRLKWLAFLSLLMCLAGITNSMLMSVTERYKEIGTLKCLGATDWFIVRVFFLEAAMIGLAASFAGTAAGVGVMLGVRGLTEGFRSFPEGYGAELPNIIWTTVAIGLLLTVVAAILPAIQAAKMRPSAALRVEV